MILDVINQGIPLSVLIEKKMSDSQRKAMWARLGAQSSSATLGRKGIANTKSWSSKTLPKKEHPIRQYLSQFITMFGRSGGDKRAADFYKWQRDNLKPVKVVSYKSNKELKKVVESYLKRTHPEAKECYKTAWEMTMKDDRIGYVDGHAMGIIPLTHGWNSFKPKKGKKIYFDLTNEIVFKDRLKEGGAFQQHAKVLELNQKELMELSLKTGHSGSYLAEYFFKGGMDKKKKRRV